MHEVSIEEQWQPCSPDGRKAYCLLARTVAGRTRPPAVADTPSAPRIMVKHEVWEPAAVMLSINARRMCDWNGTLKLNCTSVYRSCRVNKKKDRRVEDA